MLDNTRQCGDKSSDATDKKSLVFSFPFHHLMHFSHGDAEFSGTFLLAGRGMKIVGKKKIVQPSLIYGLGAEDILYKDIISFSPDFDAAEGSENRLGVDVSVVLQTGVRVKCF